MRQGEVDSRRVGLVKPHGHLPEQTIKIIYIRSLMRGGKASASAKQMARRVSARECAIYKRQLLKTNTYCRAEPTQTLGYSV